MMTSPPPTRAGARAWSRMTSANPQQRRHHGDAQPKTAGEHRAADRPRKQRPKREPTNHWRGLLQDAAIPHPEQALCPRGDREVVGDDDDRHAVGVQPVDQRDDLLPGRLIELAGRLVRQQEPRAIGERPRDGDALHLAARKLATADGRRGPPARHTRAARACVARRSARATPASASGSSTFSHAVSIGSRKNRWKTKPISRSRTLLRSASDSELTSRSSNNTCPLVGTSTIAEHVQQRRFAAARRTDDADVSPPGAMRNDTSRSAATGPAAIGNTLEMFRASTTDALTRCPHDEEWRRSAAPRRYASDTQRREGRDREQHNVDQQRTGFKYEEVQMRRDPRQRAQNRVEPHREHAASRHREQSADPNQHARLPDDSGRHPRPR